ncbi:MAG: hypothetical protein EXS31_07895 [Pedosphaera sp.]|nr:hypothetical protein [Pedosphaera sp.]
MNTKPSRTKSETSKWPRKIRLGRVTVSIYRRNTPTGTPGFLVANYAAGKRRFDSYPTETAAMEAANLLARRMSERDVLAASMTNDDAAAYSAAIQSLKPHGVSLTTAADTLAKCLESVRDLPNLLAAVKFYVARHKSVTRKRVSEVVAELLAVKEGRQSSPRYQQDLRIRLGRFADAFCKDCCDVTTPEIQSWLDSLKLSTQSYMNYRRVVNLLFEFAVARGYAADNPSATTEAIKVTGGGMEIYTPGEIRKLLAAAPPEFLPCLAIGAFAGLRSAELERLDWIDIHLAERFIVIGAKQAKTASRRVVPISDSLAAWLASYSQCTGLVWKGAHDEFYEAQQATAAAAGVKWKQNALRHSYASYRFALTNDAGRVAGECGNSAAVVHKHYRELVKLTDAEKWFAVMPEKAATNVVTLAATPM